MPIYFGNQKTSSFLSANKIGKVFFGTECVWKKEDAADYFYVQVWPYSSITVNFASASGLQYLLDDTNGWTNITSSGTIIHNNDNTSKPCYFRATSFSMGTTPWVINSGVAGATFSIGGDIQSLNNFSTTAGNYQYMFKYTASTSAIVFADNFKLSATTLTSNCYKEMFADQYAITSMPANFLPATTLAESCYEGMFAGTNMCSISSLVLSATDLTGANSCYAYMFDGCTYITTLPTALLPATTISDNCYQGMFRNCTGLTTIPNNFLPTNSLGVNCYKEMFKGCSAITTVPANLLPATTIASGCYSGMFEDCTNLKTINITSLPATTLFPDCYSYMFANTKIASVPQTFLPATTLAANCYQGMFKDCNYFITIPTLNATVLPDYCYAEMFNGCHFSIFTDGPAWSQFKLTTTSAGTNSTTNMFSSIAITHMPDTPVLTPSVNTNYYTQSNSMLCIKQTTAGNFSIKSIEQGSVDDPWTTVESHNNAVHVRVFVRSTNFRDETPSYEYMDGVWRAPTMSGMTRLNHTINLNAGDEVMIFACKVLVCNEGDLGSPWTNTGNFKLGGRLSAINRGTTIYTETNNLGVGLGYWDYNTSTSGAIYGPYAGMFKNCTTLQEVTTDLLSDITELHDTATFKETFAGCTSLTTCPSITSIVAVELRHTTKGGHFFESMFEGCTSLNQITQVDNGYNALNYTFQQMFYGCSLIKVYSSSGTGRTTWVTPKRNAITTTDAFKNMLYGTSGDVTGSPGSSGTSTAKKTYYTSNTVV